MEPRCHRDVFSWPSQEWINAVRTKTSFDVTPGDLGVNIVHKDVMAELSDMVIKETEAKRDESISIFDLGQIVERLRLWQKCFPDVQPFYAVKAFDDPVVISLLGHLGAGFDCASQAEVKLALSVGIDPDKIIYANTIKFPSHLTFAVNNKVTLMTFDNEEELMKIKRLAPESKLVLRIAPAVNQGGTVQWELVNKFGCSQQRASELLQKAHTLGLNVVGISYHVGSGCADAAPYIANIKVARDIFDAAALLGFHLTLLDIGGGLFGSVGAEEKIEKMCGPIKATLAALFPACSGVKVISEPGRYFVESALTLAACVVGKRVPEADAAIKLPTKHNTKQQEPKCKEITPEVEEKTAEGFEYYLSESAFGILNYCIYVKGYKFEPILLNLRSQDATKHTTRLWGPSCDSIDVLNECCHLPEMQIGDWVAFKDVGSYTVTVGTTFNGMPICQMRRVMNQGIWESLFHTTQRAMTQKGKA